LATDRVAIRALLTEAGLPVADLDTAPLSFLVTRDGGTLVGAIALERYGETALLRSLAVASSHRRQGVGDALVAALEGNARSLGILRLVLLTQTANAFFDARGYRVTDRAHVSGDVQGCAEFRSLCPSSATCMMKSLS
jgi:amino-acid N-acetyltransferase